MLYFSVFIPLTNYLLPLAIAARHKLCLCCVRLLLKGLLQGRDFSASCGLSLEVVVVLPYDSFFITFNIYAARGKCYERGNEQYTR